MIALDDVESMNCLDREQIAAIAENAPVGEPDAAVMRAYCKHLHKGRRKVQQMICDDLRVAMRNGDLAQAKTLFRTLRYFMGDQPEANRGAA
ncbi:hypothetical protein [Tropicimonas sp. IMCC6043]|uniref:hypothetical protein n=1 Tax=Tropicimonas sp. IMCC6043 TaxID=2510645 RepID=UPI00101C4023|nr:hypothetical protein [Tropicimonas sp. IMCC6043]RYH10556.1 hypothetical protein EU800_07345 [Tropicimonas sp. IMCC6043]